MIVAVLLQEEDLFWATSVLTLTETDVKSLSIDILDIFELIELLLQLQEICISDDEKLTGESSGVEDLGNSSKPRLGSSPSSRFTDTSITDSQSSKCFKIFLANTCAPLLLR